MQILKWSQLNFVILLLYCNIQLIFAGSENREFILEKLNGCKGSYQMQFNIVQANITKNRLIADGTAVVSKELSKDVQVILKYRRCGMKTNDKKCGNLIEYVLPKVCVFASSAGVFGIKIDNSFEPKFECPVKAQTYKMRINVSLKGIVKIPLDNIRYETKMFLQESGGKKKVVGCVEGVWWLKA